MPAGADVADGAAAVSVTQPGEPAAERGRVRHAIAHFIDGTRLPKPGRCEAGTRAQR